MRLYEQEIREYVKEQKQISAAWLGGSKATKREDNLSDIDLVLISSDADQTFYDLELFINNLCGIELIHREKRRFNYDQRFYILKDTPETYYLDVCVFDSQEEKDYAEYFNDKRHGTPVIIKDDGILLRASTLSRPVEVEFDRNYWRGKAEIYYRTFLKEAKREKYIDAFHFYFGLVQVWATIARLKQCPQKHDFSLRYINVDLDLNHALFLENHLKISSLEEMKKQALELKENIDKELL